MKAVFECSALSKSGEKSYTVEIVETQPQLLESYIDKKYFEQLCMQGCPNYNKKWSCPPFSPVYDDFTKGKKKLFLFYLHINMLQFSYIKNNYLKIKAANMMLKARADKFLCQIASEYGGYISTGSCRLCKPCKCKSGLPCAHPNRMTFSFESLGIDVGQLVNAYFDRPLLWYKSGVLPEYTSVVCGLLTNKMITTKDLCQEYLRHYRKY